MAQPSVASYFNTRKRGAAVQDSKINKVKKALVVDTHTTSLKLTSTSTTSLICNEFKDAKTSSAKSKQTKTESAKFESCSVRVTRNRKMKELPQQKSKIEEYITNMAKQETITKLSNTQEVTSVVDPTELLKTPPSTPVKINNVMDNIKLTGKELTFNEIKHKLSRSNRLAELKASIFKFKELDSKLQNVEKKIQSPDSPSLKAFKSIELEISVSPQKVASPEKPYLSPKKNITTARRNLLSALSPSKSLLVPTSLKPFQQHALTLPYKYRSFAETFRSVDTVCQIMFNRKEMITFKKLKPAVEAMTKRTLKESYLGQILSIYPDSFSFKQEKLKSFGMRHIEWEMVIEPKIGGADTITSECLLERRRKLFNILIDHVKNFHDDFLKSLDPPMIIAKENITRWHAEFNIEHVPDIEIGDLPKPPNEERFTTGAEVLEKAKSMFNCNTRMEQALQRLKEAQEKNPQLELPPVEPETNPLLKGVPKALLEKIRLKQAAKALESMTRPVHKEKELQMYIKLPEIARLIRNLYVTEKKSVLPVDMVVEKLSNSCRMFLKKSDIEKHVNCLAKEIPLWLVFHKVRSGVFLKIDKAADLNIILNKLENLIKLKSSGF